LVFRCTHPLLLDSANLEYMPGEPRLTKRQKKGIAFRERKGKSKGTAEEPADIPELEVQDVLENTTDGQAPERPKEITVPGRKAVDKKRKRTQTEGDVQESAEDLDGDDSVARKKSKKRKTEGDTEHPKVNETAEEDVDAKPKRFILFVGEYYQKRVLVGDTQFMTVLIKFVR
jgi:nucleolar protein 6